MLFKKSYLKGAKDMSRFVKIALTTYFEHNGLIPVVENKEMNMIVSETLQDIFVILDNWIDNINKNIEVKDGTRKETGNERNTN